jgi:hypothetical protein
MLLERRDKESRVDLSDYPSINYSQKTRLLEDLAYWMIKEGQSETTITIVDDTFTHKLANMPNISQEITGSNVRNFFVERSGIIREPVAGQIDFTHRTFQEFFAAQAALDAMDLPLLLANAHNDQWREVIILAAGLSSKTICEQLITGLIERGDNEKSHRYQLHLLAVSCLETAIELAPEVRSAVEQRLSKMIPPKNMTEAKELAVAGELAVKYLERKEQYSSAVAAACVRALALIGGDMALDVLESYVNDSRKAVIAEIIKAQASFDKTYEHRILLHILLRMVTSHSSIHIIDVFPDKILSSLNRFQQFTGLTFLDLSYTQVSDLTPVASLTHLTYLGLYYTQVSDLAPLASLTHLTSLNLSYCTQVSNLAPLASLTHLTSLDLSYCTQISDLAPLASLTHLTSLNLDWCIQISDLSILAKLTQLKSLYLHGIREEVKATLPQSFRKRVEVSPYED